MISDPDVLGAGARDQFGGKTIVITGAAGGVGQVLCRFFGAAGATVAAVDLSERVLELVRGLRDEGISARALVVDISDGKAVLDAFADLGTVDVLINNAAVARYPTLAVTDPQGWQDDVSANLNGTFNCSHAVLPGMVKRRSGIIINLGSANAMQALGDPAYSAAKAGIVSLTKAQALEYGRYQIRANVVLPGTVRTPVWDERKAKNPDVLKTMERWYPLGRIVEPIEIVRAIAFLASDAASAITGAVIPVDCGLSAGNLLMARDITQHDI